MTLLLNCELVSRVKLCLVCVFPDIVKDFPKIRNLSKIFLGSFENVAPELTCCQYGFAMVYFICLSFRIVTLLIGGE